MKSIFVFLALLTACAQTPPPFHLKPEELDQIKSKTVSLDIDSLHLSIFNESKDAWEVPSGDFVFRVGGSSRSLPLTATVKN